MSPVKPSSKEEEFFAKQEYERRKTLMDIERAKQAEEEKARLKALHYMHCPKCGADLLEIDYHRIKIDKCTACEGIWLDAGELEMILKDEDNALFRKIVKIFK